MRLSDSFKEEIAASVWDDRAWMRDTFRTDNGRRRSIDVLMNRAAQHIAKYDGREDILKSFITKFANLQKPQPYRARDNSRVIIFELDKHTEGIVTGEHGGLLKNQQIGLAHKDRPTYVISNMGIQSFTNINTFANPTQQQQAELLEKSPEEAKERRSQEMIRMISDLPSFVKELLADPSKAREVRSRLVSDKAQALHQRNRLLDLLRTELQSQDYRLLEALVHTAFPAQHANHYELLSKDPRTFHGYFKHNLNDLPSDIQASYLTLMSPLHELSNEEALIHTLRLLDEYASNSTVNTRSFLEPFLDDLEDLLHREEDDELRKVAGRIDPSIRHLLSEPELVIYDAGRIIAATDYKDTREYAMKKRRKGEYLESLLEGEKLIGEVLANKEDLVYKALGKDMRNLLKSYQERLKADTVGITSMKEQEKEDDAVVITARLAKLYKEQVAHEHIGSTELLVVREVVGEKYEIALEEVIRRMSEEGHYVDEQLKVLSQAGLYQQGSLSHHRILHVREWVRVEDIHDEYELAQNYLQSAVFSGELDIKAWANTEQAKTIRAINSFAKEYRIDDYEEELLERVHMQVQDALNKGVYKSSSMRTIEIVQTKLALNSVHLGNNVYASDPAEIQQALADYKVIDEELKKSLELLGKKGNKLLVEATGLEFANNNERHNLTHMLQGALLEEELTHKLQTASNQLPEAICVYAQSKSFSKKLLDYARRNDMVFDGAQKRWWMNVPSNEVEAVMSEIHKEVGKHIQVYKE